LILALLSHLIPQAPVSLLHVLLELVELGGLLLNLEFVLAEALLGLLD